MRVRFLRKALTFYVAVLLLIGCGGGGSAGGTPATPAPPAPTATATQPATTATFQLGALPSVVKSAAVLFSTGPLIPVPLPAGCPASPTCSITVPGPAGKNVSAYRVYVYTTVNGNGTALLIASGDITLIAGQKNVAVVTFHHVMSSYTLTLSPPTLTVQISGDTNVDAIAKDVTGAILTYPYYASNGGQPVFEVNVTQSDGTTQSAMSGDSYVVPSYLLTYAYSGVGPYPIKFTSNIYDIASNGTPIPVPGYPPVVATLAIRQPPGAIGYALAPYGVDVYSPGSATLARSYVVAYDNAEFVRYAPSGTLWVQNVQGPYPYDSNADAYTLSGVTPQGTATASITMPTGDSLLSFDATGRLYLANPGTIQGQPSVVVYSVSTASKLTPVRTLALAAAPCSGAADATGRLYLAACGATGGVAEYAPGSNVANVTNSTATGPVTVDGAGNVYADYGAAIGEWTVGTFGAAAPGRMLAGLPCPLADLSVDPTGDVYALTGPTCSAGNKLYYFAAGATTPTLLQTFSTAYDASYTGQHSVAAPLK